MVNIDTLIVVIYMGILTVMGLLSARKVASVEDYAVAGRHYPAWVIFATLCATLVGGGFSMGNAEKIHQYGIVFLFATFAIPVRELIVAYAIAPYMDRFKHAISIGDVMQEGFGPTAKILAGVFAGILCAGVIGVQLRAMGYIFEVFLGLKLTTGIAMGTSLVIFYVTLGGFKAVVWTDVLQFVILIIALPVAALMALYQAGGFEGLTTSLPANRFALTGHFTPLAYLSLVAYFLIGEALAPPYLQRLLMGDARNVSRAALWTGLTAIPLILVVAAMALSTLALKPDSQPHEVIPFIISTVLPVGISGFVIAAMLAIIMSSADSFLNVAAVTWVHDVARPISNNALSNKYELGLSKFFTVVIGLLSFYFAVTYQDLFDGILLVYGLWGPVILVPLVATIRGYQGSLKTLFITSFSGLLGSLYCDYAFGGSQGISGMFVGTAVSAVVFLSLLALEKMKLARKF